MDMLILVITLHPAWTLILILGVILLLTSVRIAQQYQRSVIFFLGRYARQSSDRSHPKRLG